MKNSPAGEVRDLAWAGRHGEAIERAAALLEAPRASAALRVELLALSCESRLARGELAEAAREAERMMEIARGERKPALLAQALDSRSAVEGRRGEYRAAVKTANAALKAARASKIAFREASALVRLAEQIARALVRDASAEEYAVRATKIFERLGRPVEKGRALRARGMVVASRGQIDEAAALMRESAVIARQTGDLYGLASALNSLSFHQPNLAENLRLLDQARGAFAASGYVMGGAIALNNLAICYSRLGLFARAARCLRQALAVTERIHATPLILNQKNNLASVFLDNEDVQSAGPIIGEASALAAASDNMVERAEAHYLRGTAAMLTGDAAAAIREFKGAVAIATEVGDEMLE